MRISRHALTGTILVGLALTISVPVIVGVSSPQPITTDKLTVDPNDVRPALATAEHALGAVVPKFSGLSDGNPFELRDRGSRNAPAVPGPPPPPLDLPAPPLTPFAPIR